MAAVEEFKNIELKRIDYTASKGKEVFLSYEDTVQDKLLGFIRMRLPHEPFRPEITNDSAGIRELHVYGQTIAVNSIVDYKVKVTQHMGFGGQLVHKAFEISKQFGYKKISVISGIGVRPYFVQLGYKQDGPYMSKIL